MQKVLRIKNQGCIFGYNKKQNIMKKFIFCESLTNKLLEGGTIVWKKMHSNGYGTLIVRMPKGKWIPVKRDDIKEGMVVDYQYLVYKQSIDGVGAKETWLASHTNDHLTTLKNRVEQEHNEDAFYAGTAKKKRDREKQAKRIDQLKDKMDWFKKEYEEYGTQALKDNYQEAKDNYEKELNDYLSKP